MMSQESEQEEISMERELLDELIKPKPQENGREVRTLEEFAPRFLENYARANRQKPSTVHSKESL